MVFQPSCKLLSHRRVILLLYQYLLRHFFLKKNTGDVTTRLVHFQLRERLKRALAKFSNAISCFAEKQAQFMKILRGIFPYLLFTQVLSSNVF